MKQTYKPMLARSADAPFNSKDWIFEVKWDGIRAISYVNDEVSIRSRNDKELRQNFPELEELKELTENSVLDGEIVVMKNGRIDFQAILERNNANSRRAVEFMSRSFPSTYVVFDILEKDGKPLLDLPLIRRKKILRENLKEGKHILLSEYVEDRGKSYYEAAFQQGLEGIMAKRKDSQYEAGNRSGNWLKIKKLHSCDCVIFGYTPGEGARRDTFGALILGLYDGEKPVYVGKVGTGFSQDTLEQLTETFSKMRTGAEPIENTKEVGKIAWIKPDLVCEVVYQEVTNDCKLRAPRFRRIRFDKKPSECSLDQIVQNRLHEYATRRDFGITPEPSGRESKPQGKTFVVQEHNSRRLHYDLRLEKEGVLKSWAVPKGLPKERSEKRLAVETEDHPIEYAEFEGVIPEGQYGAGTVKIWDKGTYVSLHYDEDKIEFVLEGNKLRGKYILTRFKKAGEKQWLLLKAD